jgi:hypothetical protein
MSRLPNSKKVHVIGDHWLITSHALFFSEYIKDRSPRRAAEAVGLNPETGYSITQRTDFHDALQEYVSQSIHNTTIDAAWHLAKCVDVTEIGLQTGQLGAVNSALGMVGRHKSVDAFAADKVKVTTDGDVRDRLMSAKRRMAELRGEVDDDEVSFL